MYHMKPDTTTALVLRFFMYDKKHNLVKIWEISFRMIAFIRIKWNCPCLKASK